MLQLHVNGHRYDLAEDYTISEVFEAMKTLAPEQQGITWFQLADGGAVHFHVTPETSFAVQTPEVPVESNMV